MNKLLLIFVFILLGFAQGVDSLADSLTIKKEVLANIKTKVKPVGDKWFSQDKFLHAYFSASIPGLTYYVYTDRLKKDENLGKIYAISLTAIAGLGKEIYDKKRKGHFSWKDLCWDGVGLALGYFVFIHDY